MSLSKPVPKFKLPEIHPSRFPYRVRYQNNPEIEEWANWTERTSAASKDEVRKCRPIMEYCPFWYSFCDDINLYEIAFKLFYAATIWDDRVENDYGQDNLDDVTALKLITQFSEVLLKLENKEFVSMITWDPCITTMYAILDAIYGVFNEMQRKRMITHWRNHIIGMTEESKLVRKLKTFPTLEALIKVRVESCGIMPFIQILELADQIYLPEHIREDSRMIKLDKLVATHIAQVNDLMSFEKEFNARNGHLNLMTNSVAFVAIVKQYSIEDSMKEVIKMIKQLEEEFIEIEDQFLNDENCLGVTKKYINSLKYTMGGASYGMQSKRYQQIK